MLHAVMSEELSIQDRKNITRNMFSKVCKQEDDTEHQVYRMQGLILSYGILEQIGALQTEMKAMREELQTLRPAHC